MLRLPLALLLLAACAPPPPPPPPAWTPTAQFDVSGSLTASSVGPTITAEAGETRTDTFTRRRLKLVFTDAVAGTITLPLLDNEGTMKLGRYVRFGSPQLLERATWESGGVTWEGATRVDEDPGAVELTALDWSPGGHVTGTFSLALKSPEAADREVTIAGRFDVALTTGP